MRNQPIPAYGGMVTTGATSLAQTSVVPKIAHGEALSNEALANEAKRKGFVSPDPFACQEAHAQAL